jgi:hypothetical protein
LASEVLPCEFTFVSETSEPIHGVRLADVQSLAIGHSVYVKNSGRIEIPLYSLGSTSPGSVRVSTNASSTLRPGEVAEVRLAVSARRFANRTHYFDVVAATCAAEKSLGVEIVLSEATFRAVQWNQWKDLIVVVVIGLLPLVWGLISPIVSCSRVRIKVKHRMTRLSREIGALSVSKASSVGLQVDLKRAEEVEVAGRWVRSSVTTPGVTRAGLEAMIHRISSIK